VLGKGQRGLNGKISAWSTVIRTEIGPVGDPGCGVSASRCLIPATGRAFLGEKGPGRRTNKHAQEGTNENILPVIYTHVND
jgi:hypothetical protein